MTIILGGLMGIPFILAVGVGLVSNELKVVYGNKNLCKYKVLILMSTFFIKVMNCNLRINIKLLFVFRKT